MNQIKLKRALLSLSDKSSLHLLLAGLANWRLELYSTGGTYTAVQQWLKQNPCQLQLVPLEAYLDYPEMPGGLVKTLHPRIHGGLLADLEDPDHRRHMQEQRMHAFDLLVVNLYPFSQTVAAGQGLEACRRQIDIGGVAMLRAGAKNFGRVAVLSDPADYAEVCAELNRQQGALTASTRWRLARKAFRHVLEYDQAISQYLDSLEEAPC